MQAKWIYRAARWLHYHLHPTDPLLQHRISVAKAAAELLAADAAAMASMTVAAVAGAGAVEWRK